MESDQPTIFNGRAAQGKFVSPVFKEERWSAKSQISDRKTPSHRSCPSPDSLRSSWSAPSRLSGCERVRSRADNSVQVSPLARNCCEVLGKRVCHFCGKISHRSDDVLRCESCLPAVNYNSDHAYSTILLKRYFPRKNLHELTEMVARGEVAALSDFSPAAVHSKMKKAEQVFYQEVPRRPKSQNVADDGTTTTFFTNIRDLSWKMSAGRFDSIDQKQKTFLKKFSASFSEDTNSKRQLPSFSSTRRSNTPSTSYKSYYFPPMCTKEMQERKNDFFAGDSEPEVSKMNKLPEHVIPLHVTKELDRRLEEARHLCEVVDIEFKKGIDEDFEKIYGCKP